MKPVEIKICGITTPEHVLAAAGCGADMIGLVFAPSRRQVTPEVAAHICSVLRRAALPTLAVGVFVNEPAARIIELTRAVGLDMVQLSGDEPPECVAECAAHYPVIKAVRFDADTSTEEALAMAERYASCVYAAVYAARLRLLVDAHRPGRYGGTGQLADWSLAAYLARRYPVMLAGGLNPANVAGAIRAVGPLGVDVSSGVERQGVKDPALIEEFVRAARSAMPGPPATPERYAVP
jgi:phosphoribosylanthranilate isomerase